MKNQETPQAYRLLFCFDIRDEKGRSVLKKEYNTVGVTLLNTALAEDDPRKIFNILKPLPSLLGRSSELRHLFYVDPSESLGDDLGKDFPALEIPSEYKPSCSRIYNSEDNRNPTFSSKDTLIVRGALARALRILYKIHGSFAFLFEGFRR